MKKFIKPLLFLTITTAIVFLSRYFNLGDLLNEETLREFLEQAGAWAPFFFILFYALAPVLFLPGLPITLAAGLLFGPVWGVVYAIVGATIGATLSFLLARYFMRDWIKSKIATTRFATLYEKSATQGWKLIAFTRLVPLFPFNLLNYAFGITAISLPTYVIVSFFCMLPACIAYVVLGSSLLDLLKGQMSPTFFIGALLIIVLNVGILIYRKKRGNG